MFQLIVTVISIALIAALAIASIFYGGAAFSGSSAKTAEATLVNGGQQISGAAALYRTDNGGVSPANIAALTSGTGSQQYLQAVPTPPTGLVDGAAWEIQGDYAIIQMASATEGDADPATNGVCVRAEVDNGTSNSNPTATEKEGITLVSNDEGTEVSVQFDCVTVGADLYFAYKL